MAKAPVNPKEYLIKSKFYRAVSLVFVVIGLIAFLMLYIANVEGRVMEALKNPVTILFFIIPFLPAIVLSMLASKNEKKYLKMTEGHSAK